MNKSSKICYEVGLRIQQKPQQIIDLLEPIFLAHSFNPWDITQRKEAKWQIVSVYVDTLAKAKRLHAKLLEVQLKGVEAFIEKHVEDVWINKWKDQWDIFELTDHIDVVPAWKKDNYKQLNKKPIYLDSHGAFGTGLHETSSFMSGFIEKKAGKFKTFFDIGVGTGLLSAVAYLHGANYIAGVDISQASIRVAKENAIRNNFEFDYLTCGDFSSNRLRRTFDYVAANLVSEELIRLVDKIIARVNPGGYLAISGISLPNLNRVKGVFRNKPLKMLKTQEGESWAAILYKQEG